MELLTVIGVLPQFIKADTVTITGALASSEMPDADISPYGEGQAAAKISDNLCAG